MNWTQILRITLAIIVGEVVLVLATTIAQEVLFDGIGLTSPLPELVLGGAATFFAAVVAGFAARMVLSKPHQIVVIVLSLLITIETSYLIIANKTVDPVWFDSLAGLSLIIGMWLGFYSLNLLKKLKK